MVMHIEFDILEAMVKDIAAKPKINHVDKLPESAMVQEAKRIEMLVSDKLLALKTPTQVSTMLNLVLQKLTRICDQLFEVDNAISPETLVVVDLVTSIKSTVPQSISLHLSLPKAFIHTQGRLFGEYWQQLQARLSEQGINPALIEIAGLPIQSFALNKGKLQWIDYIWLCRFFNFIENIDWQHHDCGSTEEALIFALIRLGYHHQRFLNYCCRLIKERTEAKAGRKAKLEELARCKTLILQEIAVSDPRYEPTEKVGVRLCAWVDAEIRLVAQIEPEDAGDTFNNPFKFKHKLSVLATALWYKLQYDHGVFDENSLDLLADKITKNCASKQQSEISPGSVKTKFYTKDSVTIKQIEDVLIKMLEDLRNFF